MFCQSFWQRKIRNHFKYALYDSTLSCFLPLSCSTITARFKRIKVCLYIHLCVCVCRGVCRWERVLLFAVEETLKWFVPFGALQHLGEHSLNYARSSVIVPLSRLRFTHLSLPPSPCACVLACPRSVRFATLRDLSFTHANLTANCQEQERQLKWFAVCDCLWKGTMTLPAESRAHTQKRCSMAFFYGEWRDFFGYSMKFALLTL